jgi:hypothetical protein
MIFHCAGAYLLVVLFLRRGKGACALPLLLGIN